MAVRETAGTHTEKALAGFGPASEVLEIPHKVNSTTILST